MQTRPTGVGVVTSGVWVYTIAVKPLYLGIVTIIAAASMAACGRSSLDIGEVGSSASSSSSTAGVGGFGGEGGFGGMGGQGGQGGQGGIPFDECTDEDVTFIYLVTSSLGMYAFKPLSQELEYRGQLDCPTDSTPFSMAVRRNGIAYIVFNDGQLWQASVKDASCKSTPFEVGQHNMTTFGMGFAVDDDELAETLFISDIDYADNLSKGLSAIDLDTFVATPPLPFANNPGYRIELSAKVQDLYAFVIDSQIGGGHLARVDKTTAVMTELEQIPIGENIGSWHFAWWGGQFYFFTADSGESVTTIRRYDPDTKVLQFVGTVGQPVVGAGVSTCAPP